MSTQNAIPVRLIKKEKILYPEQTITSVSLIPKLAVSDIPGIQLSKNLWASMQVSQNTEAYTVQ